MSTSSPIQSISGLASGLDTNSIISQLMAVDSQPLTLMQQQQDVEQTRKQALSDIQTRLQNLSTAISGLTDVGTWAPTQTITSSDTTRVGVQYTAGAAAGSYLVNVTSLARADQWQSNGTATSASGADTLTIGVGGSTTIDVGVKAGDSLDTIAAAINGTSGTPVFASVVNSKLVLSGIATGTSAAISISSTGTLASDLGLATADPANAANHTITAADSQYTIDSGNGAVAGHSATNTVTGAIPGVTLTLTAPTAANSPVSVTVGVSQPNTSAIQGKIQAFVDQYNSTVDFIQSKLTERPVVPPQSQADREKGVLFGDSSLDGLLSNMREAVADIFSGRPNTMNQLASAGLSTGDTTGSGTIDQDSVDGKLTLDTATLATALTTNFNDVKAMFTNSAGTTYATEGLAQRLNNLVNAQTDPTSGMLASRMSSEDSLIKSLTDQQTAMQQSLDLKQQALKTQFAAMETAMQSAQAQGQWLQGQLAGLPA